MRTTIKGAQELAGLNGLISGIERMIEMNKK
jgi:hypothetical protein